MHKALVVCLFLFVTVSCTKDLLELYKKRIYCGKQLDHVMKELCSWYNDDTTMRTGSRFKRSIVFDCCFRPCSKRFILNYYCTIPNSEFMHVLELPNIIDEKIITEEAKNIIISRMGNETNALQARRATGERNGQKKTNYKKRCRCPCRRKKLKALQSILRDQHKLQQNPVIGFKEDDDRPIIMLKYL